MSDMNDVIKFEDEHFEVSIDYDDRVFHRPMWRLKTTHNGYQYMALQFHSVDEMKQAIDVLAEAIFEVEETEQRENEDHDYR
jgi:hypothetical protein